MILVLTVLFTTKRTNLPKVSEAIMKPICFIFYYWSYGELYFRHTGKRDFLGNQPFNN